MTALPPLYPLLFAPLYKQYLWGGNRFARRYGRTTPPGLTAESWEMSDRPGDMSRVLNGPLAGRSLRDLVQAYGRDLLGSAAATDRFPLLIKLLDARERLSVQVHPDDQSARRVGGEPKAEAWVVLEADPGAVVYAGFRPGVTAARLRRALPGPAVEQLLSAIPVRAGDVVAIPGGRVHAIGAGCLMLEVQQNSDTTFRLFDWNRIGSDGKPRALHLEQALASIRWDDAGPAVLPPLAGAGDAEAWQERLVTSHFRLEQRSFSGALACATRGRSFHAVFVERGEVRVEANGVVAGAAAGTTLLVPAAVDGYELRNRQGVGRVLRVGLP